MPDYTYVTLTKAVEDKSSPLRQYLDFRFPNEGPLRKEYRSRAGELKVTGSAYGGTLGAAFDFQMRYVLDPSYEPLVAIQGFAARPDYEKAIREVIRHAQEAAQGKTAPAELDRACWALALCTNEVYRAGIFPGSPRSRLPEDDDFTPERLLSLIPEDAFRELKELNDLAQEHLLPHLSAPFHLGPVLL